MKKSLLALVIAAGFALPALAQQITVVNFGGANANAQKKAYYEPFEKTTGMKVVPVEYNGEQAKIKAMVQSGKLAPGKLVQRTIPLEEAGEVLASMDRFATVGVTVIDRFGS